METVVVPPLLPNKSKTRICSCRTFAQAASGAGQAAMEELELQTREVLEGKPPTTNIFPFQ